MFALGALLYHLLSGAPPYRADTIDELIVARAAKIAPLANTGAPRELVEICERATARDPAQRYRNAHELARALEGFEARSVLGRPSRIMGGLAIGSILASLQLALLAAARRRAGIAGAIV